MKGWFELNVGARRLRAVCSAVWLASVPLGWGAAPSQAYLASVQGNALNVTLTIADVEASVLDPATLAVRLDGTLVAVGSLAKTGALTTVRVASSATLAANSVHQVDVTFRDTLNTPIEGSGSFTVPYYVTVPGTLVMPEGIVDLNSPGFHVRPYQTAANNPNSLIWTEAQLAGRYGPNLADLTEADANGFFVRQLINFDVTGSGGGFANDRQFPGLPGSGPRDNGVGNATMEVLTYLKFSAAGSYTMGVNSDDGFRVTVGKNPADRLGPILGQYDGTHTAADVLFHFLIPAPGLYPFRLLWQNGGGNASLEWFMVRDDAKILINDLATPGAIEAYYLSSVSFPYVAYVTPGPGATAGRADTELLIELAHGTIRVDPTTIRLELNAQPITPTVTELDGRVRVSLESSGLLPPDTSATVRLEFKDLASNVNTYTYNWSFDVAGYAVLDVTKRTGLGTEDSAQPGFKARLHQVDQMGSDNLANLVARAEQQLAGIIAPNQANLAGATGGWFTAEVINWSVLGPDSVGSFADDAPVPGIPGVGTPLYNRSSIAAEVLTYVVFPTAGLVRLGVNSDDGFKVTETDQAPVHNGALVVTAPAAIAGAYHAVSGGSDGAGIARPLTAPFSGTVVYATPNDACAALTNPGALSGNVALIDRGGCSFAVKLQQAKDAGALAVIVVNNKLPGDPAGIYPVITGGTTPVDIPTVMISQPDGEILKANLNEGVSVTVTPDPTFALAEFNGSRASTDNLFDVLVPEPGVYPLRCVWYQGNFLGGLEWFSVAADGQKILLNDPTHPQSLKTYRARAANVTPSVLLTRNGSQVVLTFTGVLQQAAEVNGPWFDVAGAVSPFAASTTPAHRRFWRARSF
ncbi:MAG: hypothetical protein FJ387_02375 [Verrucomicrobia bacterium]|nr:hypothetical protein [Verrucomicrobiota bacterium]